MFNNEPCVEKAYSQECKPNYEEMAARLKKKINANKSCLAGMKDGIESGSVSLRNDQEVLYYAVIGSLSMIIPKHEKEYESLLEKIEAGK